MKLYCPSCGDEVDEADFQATGSCYYCHRAEQFIKNIVGGKDNGFEKHKV